MRTIYATSGDSLLAGANGKIFVNSATITPGVHVEVQALAEERGASSLEASLASSIPQARDGTLYMMVAGRREAFERVEPMLAGDEQERCATSARPGRRRRSKRSSTW